LQSLKSSPKSHESRFYACYSLQRICDAQRRWDNPLPLQVWPGVLLKLAVWFVLLNLPQLKSDVSRGLRLAMILAGEFAGVVKIYPIGGPTHRQGGQAFPGESCVEIWCLNINLWDRGNTVCGTIIHEITHIILHSMLCNVVSHMSLSET